MRCRHRHFNASAASGVGVYDARYISGLTDGSSVSSWTSRTGSNNLSQATAANQPTYKTGIRGGQPVVRFDGAASPNQDRMTASFTKSQPFSAVSVFVMNSGVAPGAYLFDGAASSNRAVIAINASGSSSDDGKPFIFAGSVLQENTDIRGSWQILGSIWDTTSSRLFRNGSQKATGGVGSNTFGGISVGERYSNDNTGQKTALNGDLAFLAIYGGNSVPMLRRIQYHAAYSFKLACA